MADEPALRGLIDTSVVIDLESVAPDTLPSELSIAAVTLAELAAGPHATDDPTERARRQERLQRAEATFDAIPFDAAAARAYGRVYAEVAAAGRKARGERALDLLIDGATGIWHLANRGELSWHELARRIAEGAGYDPARIRPVEDAVAANTALASERGVALRPVEEAIEAYLRQIGQYQELGANFALAAE